MTASQATICRSRRCLTRAHEPSPWDERAADPSGFVVGKGERERPIYIWAKAVTALDRYLFDHRARHRLVAQRWLVPRSQLLESIRQPRPARRVDRPFGGRRRRHC
jgi:hypothetical protein